MRLSLLLQLLYTERCVCMVYMCHTSDSWWHANAGGIFPLRVNGIHPSSVLYSFLQQVMKLVYNFFSNITWNLIIVHTSIHIQLALFSIHSSVPCEHTYTHHTAFLLNTVVISTTAKGSSLAHICLMKHHAVMRY